MFQTRLAQYQIQVQNNLPVNDHHIILQGNVDRTKGGSGLVLAICKKVVEMHGGKITATNVPSSELWIKIVFPCCLKR